MGKGDKGPEKELYNPLCGNSSPPGFFPFPFNTAIIVELSTYVQSCSVVLLHIYVFKKYIYIFLFCVSGGKKLKPCCACPETKTVRDACIVEEGEENCLHLIEAHKECMRKLGFKI